MRLTWAQVVAGVFTFAVGAGLLLLPGRLLGPDRLMHVAAPAEPATTSVQAAPPLAVRHHRTAPARHALQSRAAAAAPARVQATVVTYATRPRVVVAHVSPGRTLLQAHRTAVIRQLAPKAPLVRSRQLAAAIASAPSVKAIAAKRAPSLTARTIATLGASLRKK